MDFLLANSPSRTSIHDAFAKINSTRATALYVGVGTPELERAITNILSWVEWWWAQHLERYSTAESMAEALAISAGLFSDYRSGTRAWKNPPLRFAMGASRLTGVSIDKMISEKAQAPSRELPKRRPRPEKVSSAMAQPGRLRAKQGRVVERR